MIIAPRAIAPTTKAAVRGSGIAVVVTEKLSIITESAGLPLTRNPVAVIDEELTKLETSKELRSVVVVPPDEVRNALAVPDTGS
ncbi:hypothetical protein Ga0100231_000395 [Opitutaceae bacterium TAV4]|nr:hypothetical protein Ga0100231_000395 [Opitutaceae bacterium TAV4]